MSNRIGVGGRWPMGLMLWTALAAIGCGGGTGPAGPPPPPPPQEPPPPPPPVPGQLVAVSTTNQTITVGQTVTVIVRLTSTAGIGIPGTVVTFAVAAGGGSLNPISATTDGGGQATTTWTIGTTAGPNTLTATAINIPPLTFNATGEPGPAASLQVAAGNNQSVRVGSPVPIAPAVQAVDQFQNPVAAVPVIFAVTAGGGTVVDAAPITNTQGVAAAGAWVLGLFSADHRLTATAPNLAPVTFTATGLSGWTVTKDTRLTLLSRFAEEGTLFGGGPSWASTFLQVPPLLGISCDLTNQLIWVSVFNANMITQSGVVTWAFDNGPTQVGIWIEGSSFDLLLHPGPQSSTRLFVATLALTRQFLFTFRDFRGGVLFAPLFDVRGLALVLPEVTAACP